MAKTKHVQSGEKIGIKLTKAERTPLIDGVNALPEKFADVIRSTPIASPIVLDLDQWEELGGFVAAEANHCDDGRLQKTLDRVFQRIEKLLKTHTDEAGPILAVFNPEEPATESAIFQFKITLKEVDPPIWRRIQVQDCTLETFHVMIQIAMDWHDEHMHEFVVGERRFGRVVDADVEQEASIRLSDIVPTLGKKAKFEYIYDFGDDWRHEIVFEGIQPPNPKLKYPACVEGERACPPDDVGGVYGYMDFLEAIADPDHDQHDEMLEWIGKFDPDRFNAKTATKEMREYVRKNG